MRLRACKEAGIERVPVIKAIHLTAHQQTEFIIKDNVGFGEWDYDILANCFDENDLIDWGVDIPVFAPKRVKRKRQVQSNRLSLRVNVLMLVVAKSNIIY